MGKRKHGPQHEGSDEMKAAFGRHLSSWMRTNTDPERSKRTSRPKSWAQLAAAINEWVEAKKIVRKAACSNTSVIGWATGRNLPTGIYRSAVVYIVGIPWDLLVDPGYTMPKPDSEEEKGLARLCRASRAELLRLALVLGRETREP